MEKIRDFVNRYTTIPLMLMLGVVILFSLSCDSVDEDEYRPAASGGGNH